LSASKSSRAHAELHKRENVRILPARNLRRLNGTFPHFFSELYGFADCYPRGNLPDTRPIQLLPARGMFIHFIFVCVNTAFASSPKTFFTSVSRFDIDTTPDYSFTTSVALVEVRNNTFFLFALDQGTKQAFKEEYIAFEYSAVVRLPSLPFRFIAQRLFFCYIQTISTFVDPRDGPRIAEYEIVSFPQIRKENDDKHIYLTSTLTNGATVTVKIQFDKPEHAINSVYSIQLTH